MPRLPAGTPLWIGMPHDGYRLRRPQLRTLRLTAPVATVKVFDVPVARPAEAVLAAARDLNLLDMTVLVDALLHEGPDALPELEFLAGRDQWGASTLRRALAWCDGRAESPWESVLRVFHRACGIAVEPQFVVSDARGGFLARADLRLSGTRTLHEYDGAGHRDRDTHRTDLRRERRLANDAWLDRWYRLLRGSLLSSEGQERLRRTWCR